MSLRDFPLYRAYKSWRAFRAWRRRGYAAPSPAAIKNEVFRRHAIAGATWVETGTYRGDTTRFLATLGARVFTIEPEPALFRAARKRFANRPEIEVINAVSEAAFPTLLPTLAGDLCFWLDGHYSAGITFQGAVDTPILQELAEIEAHLPRLGKVAVLVDDIRCFDPDLPEFAAYPTLQALVDWAVRNELSWQIEHDIFIARKA